MPSASSVSASPTRGPRAASSTTKSSPHALIPVGIGKMTSVSVPTISPPARATSNVLAGADTMTDSASASSGAALLESWGISRPNASTTSLVTSFTTSISTSTGAIYLLRLGHDVRPAVLPDSGQPQHGRRRGRSEDHDQERGPEQQRKHGRRQPGQPSRVEHQRRSLRPGLHSYQCRQQRHRDELREPPQPPLAQQPLRDRQAGQLERIAARRGHQDRDPHAAHGVIAGRPASVPASAAKAARTMGAPGGRSGVAAMAMAAPPAATPRSVQPAASLGQISARNAAGPITSRPND